MKKEQRWFIKQKKVDFLSIAERLGVDPLIVRLMTNRDIEPEDMGSYLHPVREDLHDPHLLHDGQKTAEYLADAIHRGKKIRVIGDYDIDGIMATYILHTALLRVGADASWAIPDRIRDGYGLNPVLVEEARADGVEVILTCDNGIAAGTAIQVARDAKMTVLVTDHHSIPMEGEKEVLPNAHAIVNPHLKDCQYPFPDLCGAAVAWKIVFLLYEVCGLDVNLAWEYLENAAFATIGDVMPLVGENRAIVKLGLESLKRTENKGMRALFEETKTEMEAVNSYLIGYVLGPCINASGRIASARLGVELLECSNQADAKSLAVELVKLNEERKDMTKTGTDHARSMSEEEPYVGDKVLVLYEEGISESVAGIVAGRIREESGKPTLVLTRSENDPCMAKGSGRSIPAYSMFERLSEARDIMDHFGGHPMAAGLTLPIDRVDQLRLFLNEHCGLTEEDLLEEVMIDANMPFSYVQQHPNVISELNLLEPFGNGNSKPLFAQKGLKVLRMKTIGKEGQYLKFTLGAEDGSKVDALYFSDGEGFKKDLMDRFGEEEVKKAEWGKPNRIELMMTYYPSINEYNNVRTVQVIIKDYRF